MPLEVATKISELNKLWPLGTDPKSQGDDHIRMIKSVLQATDGGALTGIVRKVFTTSQTYTAPAGLKFLDVEMVGGGGGGGYGRASGIGGGGSGATYSRSILTAAAVGASQAITIGAAGLGGVGSTPTSATSGGNTSFGSLVASSGGVAAGSSAAGLSSGIILGGGVSALSGGGTQKIPGQPGWPGIMISGSVHVGGNGGASLMGTAGQGTFDSTGGMGTNGGGGGGVSSTGAANRNGGAGGAGIVILTEYF